MALDFVKQYWLQFVFSAVGAGILAALKSLYGQIKAEKKEQKVLKQAMLSLLHDRLYQACIYHIGQGQLSVNDLKNLGYLFDGYSALGGNGTCAELYNRCKNLPIEK